jgi:hypothetical protein
MKKLIQLLALVASALIASAMLLPIASAEGLEVADAKLGKGVQDRNITEEATTFAVNDKGYLWLKLTGGGSIRSGQLEGRRQRRHRDLDRRQPAWSNRRHGKSATGPSRSTTPAIRC